MYITSEIQLVLKNTSVKQHMDAIIGKEAHNIG